MLGQVFTAFDTLTERHGLDKFVALRERFTFAPRGQVDIKSMGPVRAWLRTGSRSARVGATSSGPGSAPG